jgi:hypothetical protein
MRTYSYIVETYSESEEVCACMEVPIAVSTKNIHFLLFPNPSYGNKVRFLIKTPRGVALQKCESAYVVGVSIISHHR